MLKQKIQTLVDHGMKVGTIVKEAKVPRSTFDYWFKEGRPLNEAHQERLRTWLEEYKKFIAEL